jgi:hypothetical protein
VLIEYRDQYQDAYFDLIKLMVINELGDNQLIWGLTKLQKQRFMHKKKTSAWILLDLLRGFPQFHQSN